MALIIELIGFVILIALSFLTYIFVFEKTKGEGAGEAYIIGIFIGLIVGPALLYLTIYLFDYWFLLAFILAQLALITTNNLFSFLGSWTNLPVTIFSMLLYAAILVGMVEGYMPVTDTLLILLTFFLLWKSITFFAKRKVVFYTRLLGSNNFDCRYWFKGGHYYNNQKEDKDGKLIREVVKILSKQNLGTTSDLLESLVYDDFHAVLTNKHITFVLLDEYYRDLNEQQQDYFLKRMSNQSGSNQIVLLNNQYGGLRAWIEVAQSYPFASLILETIMDGLIDTIKRDHPPRMNEMKSKFNPKNSTMTILFDDTIFKKDSALYTKMERIFEGLNML